MLKFLKTQFLILHFCCYTLMTFLMILSLILVSMLMLQLSTLCWSVIWSVATTRDGCWTWIWSTRHWGLAQEVACWFQFSKFSIDVKMDGSVLEEKSSFKMLGLYFSSKFDWGSHIISIAKTVFKIIEPLICFINFFLLRLLCIFISLPYDLVWNAVVMSGLTVLTAMWKC